MPEHGKLANILLEQNPACQWVVRAERTAARGPRGRPGYGQIVFERVWGDWGDRSAVAVYVRRLREKLDPALFATVWGVGYRFDPPAP